MRQAATQRIRAAFVVIAGCLLLVALIGPASSDARPLKLTKAEARLAAEGEALDLALYHRWASDWGIAYCSQVSRTKSRCSGSISGDEFRYCSSVTFRCCYTRHDCSFSVVVKRAGYSALARSYGLGCSEYTFSE